MCYFYDVIFLAIGFRNTNILDGVRSILAEYGVMSLRGEPVDACLVGMWFSGNFKLCVGNFDMHIPSMPFIFFYRKVRLRFTSMPTQALLGFGIRWTLVCQPKNQQIQGGAPNGPEGPGEVLECLREFLFKRLQQVLQCCEESSSASRRSLSGLAFK